MIIFYHARFLKRAQRLSKTDRELLAQKIELFGVDPFHQTLRNHSLHGEYDGYRSIDIKGNLLALYREEKSGTARFCYLGTHPELYG